MAIRTLHLTYLYNEQSGGVATFYRALMRKASDSGRHMSLVVPGEDWSVEQYSETVRIYHVAAGHSLIGDRRYRVLLPHHFLFPGSTRFKRILEQEQPDLVECCDKYSLYYLLGYYRLGWMDGTKGPTTVALTMERMDDNFGAFLNRSPIARAFCRWYMGHIYYGIPKYHIAISQYVADELEMAPTAAERRKTRILPLGVDSVGFRPPDDREAARAALREILGLPNNAKVLLYAGRISPEKNIPLLTDTLNVLVQQHGLDCHLALIGGGMLRNALAASAPTRWKGRLHLMGHIAQRETLAQYLSGADVFVHPNPREPFGIGPMEAMSCGVPVVLPNRGGVLEYANAGNSWVVEPTADAFAEAVRDVLEHPDAAKPRMAKARQTAEEHDWSVVTERYFAQYEELHKAFQTAVDPWDIPYRPRWLFEWKPSGRSAPPNNETENHHKSL